MNKSLLNQIGALTKGALLFGSLILGGSTHAQNFPDKAVHLIVPLSSGSITDSIARMVAQKLSQRLKQPVVVENKTGAGGIVALRALQSARPDGYTVGLIQSGSTVQPWTMKDFPFDVRKDFQALTLMYVGPLMLVVPPDLPVSNITEFMNYVKSNPSKAFFGSSGFGTTTHLAMELLKQSGSFQMTHVPFKGSAEVYTNMTSGGINAYFDLYGTARPMIDSGRVKVIGLASKGRLSVLPNVPLIPDVVPEFEVLGWTSFVVPNGTPKEVVAKLTSDLRAVLAEPEFQQRLRSMGVQPGGNSNAEVTQFIAAEYDKWGRVTRSAGIKPE
jgi:tripartite-type tricarboxylate transporter receptor subunit TctC